MEKKGVSGIVVSVMMILLVLASVAIVWGVVNNIISQNIEQSESCFNNYGKINFDDKYTCYNASSNELKFSIGLKDIEIEKLLIAITSESGSKSFELLKEGSSSEFLRKYTGEYGEVISAPGKNSGSTYVVDIDALGLENIKQIEVAPIINGYQCEVADSIKSISVC